MDGVIWFFFFEAISEQDALILKTARFSSDGQHVWECLAVLVAMRLWKEHWHNQRVLLTVKTDNVTALTLIRKLRVKGKGEAIIAQELALDVASSAFEPDVCEHTPGVQNGLADELSRIYEPGKPRPIPQELMAAVRSFPPVRETTWWRSLSPP